MQDSKLLCAAVTIGATLVNNLASRHADTLTAFDQLIWTAQPAEL